MLPGFFLAAYLLWAPLTAAPQAQPFELSGVIAAVDVTPGEGTPTLTITAANGEKWTVRLGSIRFLIQQNFNPKAGQRVLVQGTTPKPLQLTAHRVTLTETKQTIVLRDSSGHPLWRGQGKKQQPQ